MKKEQIEQIRHDWSVLGLSFRSLGQKYGMSSSRIYRMMSENKGSKKGHLKPDDLAGLSDEVARLKEQLRKEQLKNELLNNMITVASKELGIDIRKKSGTRQSE